MKKMSEAAKKALTAPIAEAVKPSGERHERQKMFDRYMGEPYGDEVKGRSSFIATDVTDTVEAFFGEGMEVFSSDETLVEFTPVGMDDEAAARLETKVVHHQFAGRHNGFILLSTWFKEGLIEQNAYVRAGWVERERVRIEDYEELTLEEFMELYNRVKADDADYEIQRLEGVELNETGEIEGQIPEADAATQYQPSAIISDETGEAAPISCRIRCVKLEKLYEIEAVPQDEIFVSARWNKATLDGCPCHGHRGRKRRSELLAMGFHPEDVKGLTAASESSAEQNRHDTKTNDDEDGDTRDDEVHVCEGYVLADINGDGRDELVQVWTDGDGGSVLRWADGGEAIEEVEYSPFCGWSPYLVPHRHVGRSVAEIASAWAQLKSVLWRHTLDSIYRTLYPRPEVVEDMATEDTLNDLVNTDHGRPYRVKEAGAVTWMKAPGIIGETMTLMERADTDLEKSAGATRYAQGLDPSALAKSAVGSEGVARLMNAAQRRFQMVVRTFAEVGLRELFLKMHADMRRGPVRDLELELDGEWQTISPFKWRERTDMKVKVGSGRADRDARIFALEWMLGQQKEILASGAKEVKPHHVHETLSRLAAARGLPSIDPFMDRPDPMASEGGEEPPQPDPIQMAQAQAAVMMGEAEKMKAQAAMSKAETDRAKVASDAEHRQRELALTAQIEEAKARRAEAELAIKAHEVQIKEADARVREAVAAEKIRNDAEDREGAI